MRGRVVDAKGSIGVANVKHESDARSPAQQAHRPDQPPQLPKKFGLQRLVPSHIHTTKPY